MSLSVCISVYIVGFLVFPFFYSLVDGWPFVSPRVPADDVFVSVLLCAVWPMVASIWLAVAWWCGVSWLGVLARGLCGRLMKTLSHAYEHYRTEAK